MKVLEMMPADMHFITMFKSRDLFLLNRILENMKFTADMTDPVNIEAHQYLQQLDAEVVAQLKRFDKEVSLDIAQGVKHVTTSDTE